MTELNLNGPTDELRGLVRDYLELTWGGLVIISDAIACDLQATLSEQGKLGEFMGKVAPLRAELNRDNWEFRLPWETNKGEAQRINCPEIDEAAWRVVDRLLVELTPLAGVGRESKQ